MDLVEEEQVGYYGGTVELLLVGEGSVEGYFELIEQLVVVS